MSQKLKICYKKGGKWPKNAQNGLILVSEKKNEFNGWKLNVMQYWTHNCDKIWEKMNFDFF